MKGRDLIPRARMIFESRPAFFFILLLTFWSTGQWWIQRALDGSDDPWGIGALFILLLFGGFFRQSKPGDDPATLPYLPILVYGLTFPFLPNLVRGIIAAFVFARVVSLQRGSGPWHLGTWALASLSLPWLSSLQFFLGYPMRWITTKLSAIFLTLSGLEVHADGLILVWGPVEVWVDAPCSGVKMLWVGMFFVAALSYIFRLKNTATLGLLTMGLVATIIGNIIRASSVFYMEAGIIKAPAFFHDLIGLVTFATITGLVSALAVSLKQHEVRCPPKPSRLNFKFLLLSAIVGLSPFIKTQDKLSTPVQNIVFPSTLEGALLSPRPLAERDIPYLKDFPGELKTYQTDTHEILIRYVRQATRKLHSATDCYKGLGYDIVPLKRKGKWARYRARKGETSYIIEERIRDNNGKLFYDIGSWYWAAKFSKSQGPWWSEVRVREKNFESQND